MLKTVVLFVGQNILSKLYILHALAQKTEQPDLAAWAYTCQQSLVAQLQKIPRENPIKPLIPPPDSTPTGGTT